MSHRFATLGLIIGFGALILAAFESHLIATNPPPEDTRTLSQLAAEAGKKTLKEKFLKEEATKPPPKPFSPVRLAYTLLGLIAMALGTVSWIRKEHIRMAGGAIAVGLIAICWHWVLIGVGIAIVIFILANLSI
jgi:hypothetical protein